MGRCGRSWQDLCYTPIQALLRRSAPSYQPAPSRSLRRRRLLPAEAAFVLLGRPAQAAREPSAERPSYARTASYAISGG
jgi:hypothetical protein